MNSLQRMTQQNNWLAKIMWDIAQAIPQAGEKVWVIWGLLKNPHQKNLENCLFAWFVYFEASVRTFMYGRGKTPNAERWMLCLLAVSFTCVCLLLAFICWKGPNTIKCSPFQQIKANHKQTQVKLTASKQCIWRSAFSVLPLPPLCKEKCFVDVASCVSVKPQMSVVWEITQRLP